ncbi:MAG: zinc dependent phospholipase C family protein [Candidatus Acidiferrales bacterium]
MRVRTVGSRQRGRPNMRACAAALMILALVFGGVTPSSGYSVLTHEAIIDSAWVDAIVPVLRKRFPDATPEDIKTAHAYAYGGCAIQDMGYYPFGSKWFSDLVHYVRTGDFIAALLRDSHDINEYAFALGALAHYAADNDGHRVAVNPSVGLLYPKLHRKFGAVVTYEDDPKAHLKTEFAFDVLQVARGHYAPDDYREYIGFEVSEDLLQRAFLETYGIELKSLFPDFALAIGSYRRAVSKDIPRATKVAWQVKKDDIQKEHPGTTQKAFLYHLSRTSYERQWHQEYQKPSLWDRILAFFIRIIPKIGPLQVLTFRTPTPETERKFAASFDASVTDYEGLLTQEKQTGRVALRDDNFDTGSVTGPGEYPLADKTYARLVDNLAKNKFANVTPELQSAILNYYHDPSLPFATKKDPKEWKTVTQELAELKAYAPKVSLR